MALLGGMALATGCEDGSQEPPPPVPPEEPAPPGPTSVGMSPMPRLNLVEYRNTVRDLLGTTQDPTALFPADNISHGFDNIAESLTVSPVHLQLYEQSARDLAREALAGVGPPTEHTEGENLPSLAGVGHPLDDGFVVESNGIVQRRVTTIPGVYTLRARVWASLVTENGQTEPVVAAFTVDGTAVETFDVIETPELVEVEVTISSERAGQTAMGLQLTNDYAIATPVVQDRNLYVDWIEVEGPAGEYVTNDLVPCNPSAVACREQVLRDFASRAFRRPVEDREVEALEGLVQEAMENGDAVGEGLEAAITGVLLSPHFLYRPELLDVTFTGVPQPLDDYEIASRLSYFLWSSMPDDELFEVAAAGRLHETETLEAQVDRMLADPRASALVDNFAGQWLLIRSLDRHTPLASRFPEYDDELKESLRQELRLYFGEFVAGRVGLDQLLNADFSFIDARLANHYGLPAPSQTGLVRVPVPPERAGLLGKGAILTLTSHLDATSPVKRGVWILESLLCTQPPPPPPDVEELPEGETENERDLLQQHLADPACATCHSLMDPLGLALENFDAVGRWRTEYQDGTSIDPRSELSTGQEVSGPRELMDVIQADDRFGRCMAKQLFIYGLGRGVQDEDDPHLDRIAEELIGTGYDFPALIKLLVTSQPFLTRRELPEESP